MDKQAQDKRWNRLSEREQAGWLENYKWNKDMGNKESMKIVEDLFGKENLQPKLTYEDVARELVVETDLNNVGIMMFVGEYKYNGLQREDVFSVKQAEKLLAINRLLNVAKFLNKDWKPDWSDNEEKKFFPSLIDNDIRIGYVMRDNSSPVYFRTAELVNKAMAILGEDTVRMALGNF